MSLSIDINCDLGEGVGNDALLMPYLSSCNIACGGHAGDEVTMRKTIALALRHGVRIGAHPSFPDRENFGRAELQMDRKKLIDTISNQVNSLLDIANELEGPVHHIKPHGALYNMAAVDQNIAEAVIQAHLQFDKKVILYAPYGSMVAELASKNSIPVKFEAFADRQYNDDLSLVSRKLPGATLHKPDEILHHVLSMVKNQKIKTIDGHFKKIIANTICVHGDNPNAVEIIASLCQGLKNNNIQIEKA